MTEEQFIEVKETYLKNIKRYMQEEGGLFSHISIIAEPIIREDADDKNAIIHIPIPEKIANSDEGKEYFITKMIPEIAKTLKKQFDTTGVVWASEAWVRSANKDSKDPLENWKDMPIKKVVLMISIESKFGNEALIYEIVRKGMQVTEDGLADTIELIKDEKLSGNDLPLQGRFTGLYQKFI
jgi:C-terminal processing protease CtpA/Prc